MARWKCATAPSKGCRERSRELPSVPPERNDAAEAPQGIEISPQDPQPERLLEADNSPDPVKKAEPRKAENCGHCGKPLATLRSAASRYCDRYCARDARKARARELPIGTHEDADCTLRAYLHAKVRGRRQGLGQGRLPLQSPTFRSSLPFPGV
jgi:hypothetical protein